MTAPKPDEILNVESAACLFRGLGDRTRLAIVQSLAVQERRVVDLTLDLGLAQSTVSGHLACLRDCGLVTSRAVGRQSYYSLAQPSVLALLDVASTVLAETGDLPARCETYGSKATT